MYIKTMKKKYPLTTNIYFKDRLKRDACLRKTVITSSAVEGVGKSAAKALKTPGSAPTSA
jgi:hypothetical protein